MALGSTALQAPGNFPGGKGGRCVRLTTLPPSCAVVMKSGNLYFLEPSGPLQACNGTALPFIYLSFVIRNQSWTKRHNNWGRGNIQKYILSNTVAVFWSYHRVTDEEPSLWVVVSRAWGTDDGWFLQSVNSLHEKLPDVRNTSHWAPSCIPVYIPVQSASCQTRCDVCIVAVICASSLASVFILSLTQPPRMKSKGVRSGALREGELVFHRVAKFSFKQLWQ